MRSLFAKIFLSFFATVLILGAFLQLSTMTRDSILQSPAVRDLVRQKAGEAAATYETGGPDALRQSLDEFPSGAVMLDASGAVLADRPGEDRSVADAAKAALAAAGGPPSDLSIGRAVSLQSVTGPSGKRYVLAIRTPHERFGATLATLDAHPIVRGTVLIVVAGIVCWLLARHITAPLVRLRVAAGRMAEGDLDARTSRPLTKRRDEIGALGRDFDQMAERLSALVKTERQLLADVSHELRSPLARLTVAAGLLRQRGDDGPELERIDREVARLDTIIGQSLTLTRVSSGLGSGKAEKFDLSNLVQEIVADGDFEARSSNRRVIMTSVDICSSTGVPDLIRSAVENVVRNAIRHTPPGTSVDVSLRASDGHAHITVRDHGPGIPEDLLKEVFLPFRRADGPGRPASNGAGLGLAIADRVVRAHGGTVEARNAADGGLVVEIALAGVP